MLKNIKKKCIIDEDIITITLSDPRDNYIYEYALGDIGNIYLSEEGVMINQKN